MYCEATVHSNRIAHAERHVQTKGHIKEQQYFFMKQQRLKDRSENRRHFQRLETKLDDYAKTILVHLKGLQ